MSKNDCREWPGCSVPEAFLATDAILSIYLNIAEGFVVYPKVIESHIMSELPFMATENIMMQAVKKGGDRQELHERIRQHSMAAAKVVKEEGKANDLLTRIAGDPAFGLDLKELESTLSPKEYIGCAPEQTKRFIDDYVTPVLDRCKDELGVKTELNV